VQGSQTGPRAGKAEIVAVRAHGMGGSIVRLLNAAGADVASARGVWHDALKLRFAGTTHGVSPETRRRKGCAKRSCIPNGVPFGGLSLPRLWMKPGREEPTCDE
jgi:hypothetical protein